MNNAIATNVKKMMDSSRFYRLPLYAQKILSRKGGFINYDVVYDDERQLQYLTRRANACGVVLNNGKPLFVGAESETCTGRLLNCFAYLAEYLKADDGYIGGMTMRIDDLSNITDNELADFCVWIDKFLTNFLEGMKYNNQMKHKVNIIYGLEEDDGDNDAPDAKEMKSRIEDAKTDAAKVKKPEAVKKFLDDNTKKIDELSKKMKGEQKKAFDTIINKMREYANGKQLNEGDTSAKVICGCVAVIMWLIGLGPAWVVGALSPIVGPILLNAVKKIG